jgi:quercetin dioxygenase-like cupin family protein
VASFPDGEHELAEGDIFILEVGEEHRFRTSDSTMDIIAFHPDSDTGPTDEDHPMINRTIIEK